MEKNLRELRRVLPDVVSWLALLCGLAAIFGTLLELLTLPEAKAALFAALGFAVLASCLEKWE